jgi:hypothetical protein
VIPPGGKRFWALQVEKNPAGLFFFGKKKETQNNNKTRRGERNAQRTQRRAVICIIFQFDPKGTEKKTKQKHLAEGADNKSASTK